MELPTPSENQPDQPSSSSRLVTLKYVLWESAVSHISVFSKGNHKLGGKNTELIDLLHFLIVCVVHKYLFSHGAGSRSWEALAGDDRCHCILALCARPHASTVSQFPVRLLSFHQPGQIRVGLSGFFVGPACEQRFAGGHFEYSLTSR